MARNLAFEVGFDWDVPAIIGVRDGVFPLQLALVNDDEQSIISPTDFSAIGIGDNLSFRVYDFTDVAQRPSTLPQPNVLKVLFTTAVSGRQTPQNPDFSPILDQALFVSVVFHEPSQQNPVPTSIAYKIGTAIDGWRVEWHDNSNELGPEVVTLDKPGRFNFRALLTVGVPGEVVRFYRIDPEMVIGDAGDPRLAYPPAATARR